jgi:hypothetical protein
MCFTHMYTLPRRLTASNNFFAWAIGYFTCISYTKQVSTFLHIIINEQYFINVICIFLHSNMFVCNAGRTADPLSPVGTAFSFNRPKRQAAEIANTSLVLQFASAIFVNSFLQG